MRKPKKRNRQSRDCVHVRATLFAGENALIHFAGEIGAVGDDDSATRTP